MNDKDIAFRKMLLSLHSLRELEQQDRTMKELKDAASEFVKAFINIGIKPEGCLPTVGSVAGSFGSFIACCQRKTFPEMGKVLFIDPGFPIQKAAHTRHRMERVRHLPLPRTGTEGETRRRDERRRHRCCRI